MKYNFHKHKDKELHVWALCNAIGPLTKAKMEEIDSSAIDIQLIVEGKEIDFLEFTDNLYNQVVHIAKGIAQGFIEDKFHGISNDLCMIEEIVKEKLDAMWKEVG